MTENDKSILKLFSVVLIFFLILTILVTYASENISLVELVSGIFAGFVFSFFISGLLAYKYNKKCAIMPTKKIFKWFGYISLVIAIVVLFLILLVGISLQEFSTNIGELLAMAIFLCIVLILVIFVIIIVLFFAAFGIVGVLAAMVRAFAPNVLVHVSRITISKAITKAKKKRITKLSTIDSIISWAFAIPDVLETKTLKINKGRPRKWFPWSGFYKAIWWQTLFGAVIIVYISFNPLYVKSELDFRNLFSIASNMTIFVPFIILPWFIFLRLDAKIKGQVKDYALYRGIVYRMYQTFFTLGTIIIIIRLGLERIDTDEILLTLPMYYIFFMATIILLTFIYFNYFENGLAWEIRKRYNIIKEEKTSS
jgi:hypothetical protein